MTCEACFKRPAWIGASIHGEHLCAHCLMILATEANRETRNPIAITKALVASGDTAAGWRPYVTLDKDSIVSTFVARDDNGEVKHVSITITLQEQAKEKEV